MNQKCGVDMIELSKIPNYTASRNACKLCSPLGASMVFKGIKGCIPLLHGSQGCATYIRRYMISHFKEPVDIASSNFSEETAIYGGGKNFFLSMDNIISQYKPEVIGIASTCLSETIGEDLLRLIREYMTLHPDNCLPYFVHASTPSYQGTHMDGFNAAVLSAISSFVLNKAESNHLNIFPGFVSPSDIRHLKEILGAFGLPLLLFPDYSDTLDNEYTSEYPLIPEGGTPVEEIRKAGSAIASIEFGSLLHNSNEILKPAGKISTAGEWLELRYQVPLYRMNMPIGIGATDIFFKTLETLTEKSTPEYLKKERGILVDSYVDAHKYLFGKRAVVYGEEDLVIGMVSFLNEIGVKTVLAGSGGESNLLKASIEKAIGSVPEDMIILNGLDFETINDLADDLQPDIFIGSSKGYYISRRMGKPLVRVGFPVHDRFGGQRIQHLCYRGTQQLFDRIVNALLEAKQEQSPVGYKYL